MTGGIGGGGGRLNKKSYLLVWLDATSPLHDNQAALSVISYLLQQGPGSHELIINITMNKVSPPFTLLISLNPMQDTSLKLLVL